jgi:hypothetical protein
VPAGFPTGRIHGRQLARACSTSLHVAMHCPFAIGIGGTLRVQRRSLISARKGASAAATTNESSPFLAFSFCLDAADGPAGFELSSECTQLSCLGVATSLL